MNQLIQQLITGLSIGGIYALLAVGYSLIYSIFNFTNFSFGAIMMTSAFAGYFAISKLGLTSGRRYAFCSSVWCVYFTFGRIYCI